MQIYVTSTTFLKSKCKEDCKISIYMVGFYKHIVVIYYTFLNENLWIYIKNIKSNILFLKFYYGWLKTYD